MNHLQNRVQLIGNLGKDVEFKELENGNAIARVTIATKEIYKNAQGEKQV
ncbi:MAG: single-stranded DNA-binding protein, partial [Saprospiraceae bacterium]|nr:single-stranded DNA-binding protein [Saprospiraceae bacterium]